MRPLNDYFLSGGNIANTATGSVATPVAVCPEAGRLIGFFMNVHTIGDAAAAFDIIVNAVDSTVDAVMTSAALPDETGELVLLATELNVRIGDAIQAQSQNDQSAAQSADFTWVIRR